MMQQQQMLQLPTLHMQASSSMYDPNAMMASWQVHLQQQETVQQFARMQFGSSVASPFSHFAAPQAAFSHMQHPPFAPLSPHHHGSMQRRHRTSHYLHQQQSLGCTAPLDQLYTPPHGSRTSQPIATTLGS
jgi:hypothetical protein